MYMRSARVRDAKRLLPAAVAAVGLGLSAAFLAATPAAAVAPAAATAATVAAPSAPRSLTATAYPTHRTANVTWIAPATAGSTRVQTYYLRTSTANSTTSFSKWVAVTGTKFTVGGLSANASYLVQVRARNATSLSPVATLKFREVDVVPAAPPAPVAVPIPVPANAKSVLAFGAVGNGVTDDTAAIQRALNSLAPGDTLVFPAGRTFAHAGTITVGQAGVRLTGGATLLATKEQTSMVLLNNNNIHVDNLTFKMASTTKRWSAYEQMKLRLRGFSGITLTDVKVDGSAAAGIYIGGARNFTLTRVTVQNTRADAIHMTEGASYGTVTDAVVRNPGDDGVAVVSYAGDGDVPSTNITVVRPRVFNQTWGRAFSVVGGTNITYRNVYAERSSAAAIYIAAEANWHTYPVSNILVDGATINYANQTAAVDHGAVMLYNGESGVTNHDITVRNVRITKTRTDASREVAILNDSGAQQSRLTVENVSFNGGPQTAFTTNAPASSYRLSGWTDDGKTLPAKVGW